MAASLSLGDEKRLSATREVAFATWIEVVVLFEAGAAYHLHVSKRVHFLAFPMHGRQHRMEYNLLWPSNELMPTAWTMVGTAARILAARKVSFILKR